MSESLDQSIPPDIEQVLAKPVFIVGAPRSGTTWVQRLLLSHPAIRGGQESNFFCAFGPILHMYKFGEQPGRLAGLPNYWTEPALTQEIRSLWDKTMLSFVVPGADGTPPALLIEKTPGHAMFMDVILKVLPEARFVHVIRDSRSVAASLLAAKKDDWAKMWAPTQARDAALTWYHHVTAARKFGKALPAGKYSEVFYEDFHANPAANLTALLNLLNLPLPADRVQQIVDEQSFEKQKSIGGTPFARHGKFDEKQKISEPKGFFRRGEADGWRQELTWRQKLTIWRFTRKLMAQCGYSWSGRQRTNESGTSK
jgi:Sulfotransferase family